MDDDNTVAYVLLAVGWFFVGGFIGSYLGEQKGRTDGFMMGAFLGPIGWIIVLLLPEEGVRCGACGGVVPRAATKCKHCASGLELKTIGTNGSAEFDYRPMNLREPEKPLVALPPAPVILKEEYVDVECPDCFASLSVKKDSLARGVNCPMCQSRFALK